MEHLEFPENTPNRLVVPSNEKGTGFLLTCYDHRILNGVIKEAEFNFVIEQAAKINSRVYSQKRIGDTASIPKNMVTLLILGYFLTVIFFVLIYIGMEMENYLIEYVAYFVQLAAVMLVVSTSLMNYCMKHESSKVKFSDNVKRALDDYFSKINTIYEPRGMHWWVVKGHYWMELHIRDDVANHGCLDEESEEENRTIKSSSNNRGDITPGHSKRGNKEPEQEDYEIS